MEYIRILLPATKAFSLLSKITCISRSFYLGHWLVKYGFSWKGRGFLIVEGSAWHKSRDMASRCGNSVGI